MSQSNASDSIKEEYLYQPEISPDTYQLEQKLIFEDPPDIATYKDLILDHHPTNFKWWSGCPEPEERRNIAGLTPLAVAVKQGKVEEAKALIEGGARADVYGPTFGSLPHLAVALEYAGIHQIFPLLRLVLEAGADVNAPGPEPKKESLLCLVINTLFLPNYRHAICRYLIEEAEVDVNTRCHCGTYPIILAATDADKKLVHYLIQHGADVDVSDHQGLRAVHYAGLSASNRSLGSLIKAGADLLSPDNYGRTPLHFAASHCHWSSIGTFIDLLPQGYDINVRDDDGWTPLMWACKNSRSEALKIQILVRDYDADVWPVSYDGKWSALKLANYTVWGLEGLWFLSPPKSQRERTLEDGTKQIWDPEFHEISPGGHHNFNSCASCFSLTPRPLYNCVDCSQVFILCFKCFQSRRQMHNPDHTFVEHVEPKMSEGSDSDTDCDI
ncbi:hypothetical protein HYE67_010177 [Fusarium culmorum]|uniref:C2H2-type domain-containing protein n=1 Tax=Fusarium culmorum TaxID=5516 RepID=A0A7S8HZZ3_FUSCU|nr:hypothetical protein HYE67_010177 [Fusarium culmorum]